jgi:nitroreductase
MCVAEEHIMNVHEVIQRRRSVREFASRSIPAASIARLRDALRYAPSACNLQPWQFVFVADADLRAEVAKAANGQLFIAAAPLVVVGCGYPDLAYQRMGGRDNSVAIDVAIALDHLSLAAVAEGLGTCWIGAFDQRQVKSLLHITAEAKIIAMMPVGFPRSEVLLHPIATGARKDEAAIFDDDYFRRRT